MAILIANDGDKIVANISARDALPHMFDGMHVTVLDTIADANVGGGEAGYIWRAATLNWILTWKENKDGLIFTTEISTILNGNVTASHTPQDAIVWDCRILNGSNLIIAEVIPNVTGKVISVNTMNYEGMMLSYTYGYGIIQASVQSVTKYTVGLGNVDNTSDVNKPVSTATQTALDLKADKSDTYTKAETLSTVLANIPAPTAFTTLVEYGITNAYTKTEVDTAIAVESARAVIAESNLAPQSTTYTKTEVNAAITGATPTFTSLTGKPTTLSGYGITDALSTGPNTSLILTNGGITTSILTTIDATPNQIIDIAAISIIRSAKYLIQATSGTSYQSSELIAIHDGFDAFLTEYANVYTGSSLSTYSVIVSGGNMQLLATPNNNITSYKIVRIAVDV